MCAERKCKRGECQYYANCRSIQALRTSSIKKSDPSIPASGREASGMTGTSQCFLQTATTSSPIVSVMHVDNTKTDFGD